MFNLSPGLAGWASAQLFCRTPRRRPTRAVEQRILDRATVTRLGLDDRELVLFGWGDAGPTVLLAHGWGGSTAQLAGFVEPLVARGFRVLAFDQPGHGASPGRSTDVAEMARMIGRVATLGGPIHGLVAHSLGAAAAALAIGSGVPVERIALLAPAVEPGRYWLAFTRWLGLSPTSRDRATDRFLHRLGIPLEGANISHTLAAVEADVLVVHDELDRSTSVDGSRALVESLEHARGLWTRGLGHARGLRDPAVIGHVVDLVATGRWPADARLQPCATRGCPHTAEPPPAGDGRWCLSCAIEHDLRSSFGDHAPVAPAA